MAWQDILNNFKQQFDVVGPEKYGNLDNPDLRYELASQRNQTRAEGISKMSGMVAQNVATAQSEAASKAKEGYVRKYNKSGGYSFYDPNGRPVSAMEFAISKGVPVSEVLQGSYDPGDIQFLEDADAMRLDVASGAMDYQEASERLAQDYPNIFMGKGAPTPGKNYGEARLTSGQEFVQGQSYEGVTGNAKADKKIQEFVSKANTFRTRAQAEAEYNKAITGTKFKNQTERKAFLDTMAAIIDEMFPSTKDQSNSKYIPI